MKDREVLLFVVGVFLFGLGCGVMLLIMAGAVNHCG